MKVRKIIYIPVERQCNWAKFEISAFETRLQVLSISDCDFVDSTEDNNKASKYFASSEDIVNSNEQFDADKINIRDQT